MYEKWAVALLVTKLWLINCVNILVLLFSIHLQDIHG